MAAEIPFTNLDSRNEYMQYTYGSRAHYRWAPGTEIIKNILGNDPASPYKVSAQYRKVDSEKLLVGIDVNSPWTQYRMDIEILGACYEGSAKKAVDIFRVTLGSKEKIIIIAGKEKMVIDLERKDFGKSRL